MEIGQRIPDLSDKELENLQANAVRLADSGSAQQQEHAKALLPLLETALEERRVSRIAAQTERRRARAGETAASRRDAKGDGNE